MPLIGTTLTSVAVQTAANIGGVSLTKLRDYISSDRSISSLADLSKPARVEPLVIIDEGLRDSTMLRPVLGAVSTLFTGYYLQGAAMVLDVGKINTLKYLDSLNPTRSVGSNLTAYKEAVFGKETFADGLPALEAFEEPIEKDLIGEISFEAMETPQERDQAIGVTERSMHVGGDAVKKLYEENSLAVGRMINVELKSGNHSATLPVLIRLIPTYVPQRVLTHIFTATGKQNNWRERFHLMRAGAIRPVRDFILTTDLIDKHRRALLEDTSNVYQTIHERRSNNNAKAVATGTPSMADASNIAVITPQTARDMAREMGGRIDSPRIRQRLFDASFLILLVVVDDRWERATIYARGNVTGTEVKLEDLKGIEKSSGPNINDILSAYRLGSTPSL